MRAPTIAVPEEELELGKTRADVKKRFSAKGVEVASWG